jgi:ABC-type antimicrobial peptide transport system permease subunit
VYFAEAQRPSRYNFIVARTGGDASTLVTALRRELLAMEPGLVFMDASTIEEHMATALMPARVGATLATAFGGLGTLLAAIGLYGVIAFSVARRTREIGVRMALGAGGDRVRTMVLLQMGRMLLIGGVIGIAGALAAGWAAQSLLYGMQGHDPMVVGLGTAVLTAIALAAAYVPAQRASQVDPMQALRYD